MSNKVNKILIDKAVKTKPLSKLCTIIGNAFRGFKSTKINKHVEIVVKDTCAELDNLVEKEEKDIQKEIEANNKARINVKKGIAKLVLKIKEYSKKILEKSNTYAIESNVDSVEQDINNLLESEENNKPRIKVLREFLSELKSFESAKAQLKELTDQLSTIEAEAVELKAKLGELEITSDLRKQSLEQAKANVKVSYESILAEIGADNSKSTKVVKFVADYVVRPVSIVARKVWSVGKKVVSSIIKFFS